MRTLILVLILLSFFQSTIIPLDLILIALICRSFIKEEKVNFYLAFGFGLLISHLKLNPMGFESIIYLIIVALTQSFSRSRFNKSIVLIAPLAFVLLLLNQSLETFFLKTSFSLSKIIWESILILPVFSFLKLWEERFNPRKNIKLKIPLKLENITEKH